jgi:hypothetical protein
MSISVPRGELIKSIGCSYCLIVHPLILLVQSLYLRLLSQLLLMRVFYLLESLLGPHLVFLPLQFSCLPLPLLPLARLLPLLLQSFEHRARARVGLVGLENILNRPGLRFLSPRELALGNRLSHLAPPDSLLLCLGWLYLSLPSQFLVPPFLFGRGGVRVVRTVRQMATFAQDRVEHGLWLMGAKRSETFGASRCEGEQRHADHGPASGEHGNVLASGPSLTRFPIPGPFSRIVTTQGNPQGVREMCQGGRKNPFESVHTRLGRRP